MEILRLKKDLVKLKEQDDVRRKRPFPGAGIASQKQKRSAKPSPFPTFSQSQSSQQSQRQDTPQPSKVEGLATPPSCSSMPTLMSMASSVNIPSPKKPKVPKPQPKKNGLTETEKNVILFLRE